MAYVVTFENYRPPARSDGIPWTEARIDEAATSTGTWVELETVALSPVDADPANPQSRDFTTELGTALNQWYRIVFLDATGDQAQPTTAVQNTAGASTYATVDELMRILKIRTPTDEQLAAGDRVLVTAAGEIAAEIDLAADTELSGWQLSLVAEVNLERAVEHWRQQESPFGLMALGAEFGPSHTATNSWNRHAEKLAPLKRQWGFS